MKKVVVITGASSGIGEATARRFALQGWRVVMAARSAERMETIAEQLRGRGGEVLVLPTDVTDHRQLDELIVKTVEHWGRVDLLVNNAGRGLISPVSAVPPEELEHLFRLNLFAPVHAIRAVVPHMRRQGSGTIINVSSVAEKVPGPLLGLYSASKIALSYISDAARVELDRDQIRVVNVLPGETGTSFWKNTRFVTDDSYDLMTVKALWKGQSTREMVAPSEVADTIWRAAHETPRQAHVNRLYRPVASLAPVLTGPLVKLGIWGLNRYIPRRGESVRNTPERDLVRAGTILGGLALGGFFFHLLDRRGGKGAG